MELLKQKIRDEGRILSREILKVDSFLNHQIDPMLMRKWAGICGSFKERITKVLTLEALACHCHNDGISFRIPVVLPKKAPFHHEQ